jgi:hypothetical protein
MIQTTHRSIWQRSIPWPDRLTNPDLETRRVAKQGSSSGDRCAARITRWLHAHPAFHFVGLVAICVAAATGRATVVTGPRVLIGALIGIVWATWFQRVVMPAAIRNIGDDPT